MFDYTENVHTVDGTMEVFAVNFYSCNIDDLAIL